MTKEKGILDDIEELVGDFQKKKPLLAKLSSFDFVKRFEKMDMGLTNFDGYHYKQEYPPEL